MTSPKAATFPKRTRRPKPIGAAGVAPADSAQLSVLAFHDCSVGGLRAAGVVSSTSSSLLAPGKLR